jgi:hypothetical protein
MITHSWQQLLQAPNAVAAQVAAAHMPAHKPANPTAEQKAIETYSNMP